MFKVIMLSPELCPVNSEICETAEIAEKVGNDYCLFRHEGGEPGFTYEVEPVKETVQSSRLELDQMRLFSDGLI